MIQVKKVPLGVIAISVVMFFVAVATDIFWIARLLGKAFPPPLSVDPSFYDAFAAPDILLSLFLYVGSFGLLRLKRYGFVASLVAMGMWIFDTLLVFSITKWSQVDIVGFSVIFSVFAIVYLWVKKDLFE